MTTLRLRFTDSPGVGVKGEVRMVRVLVIEADETTSTVEVIPGGGTRFDVPTAVLWGIDPADPYDTCRWCGTRIEESDMMPGVWIGPIPTDAPSVCRSAPEGTNNEHRPMRVTS